MKITERELRRIIKEQMASKKIQQVAVEWELGDHDSTEGFDNLPPIVNLPSSVMAEYRAELAEYGEQDAAHVISNWLDDTFGWLSQWEFIGPRRLREAYVASAIGQVPVFAEWSADGLVMELKTPGDVPIKFRTQRDVRALITMLEELLDGPMRTSP